MLGYTADLANFCARKDRSRRIDRQWEVKEIPFAAAIVERVVSQAIRLLSNQ